MPDLRTMIGPTAGRVAGFAAAISAAILVGAAAPRFGHLDAKDAVSIVGVAVGGTFFALRHPKWALLGVFGASVLGLARNEVSLGLLNLRAIDLPYVVLVAWAVTRRRAGTSILRASIGQRTLLFFCLALSATLVPTWFSVGGSFSSTFVALARILQSLSLLWLVPYAVRRSQDIVSILRWIIAFIAFEVGKACVDAVRFGTVGQRVEGSIGPNTIGLVSGLLIVLVLYSRVVQSRLLKVLLVALGAIGLIAAESLGSLAAVGIAIGFYGFGPISRQSSRRQSALIRPARVGLLFFGIFGIAMTIKGANLPTSEGFEETSTGQRVILGAAGLEIFANHPVTGVGWSRSGTAEVIGSEEIATNLRRRFEGSREIFFPDVNPSSVHNAYIQVLAESGVIGGAALVGAMVTVRRRLRELAPRLDPPRRDLLYALSAALVLLLVWFNDSAVFGGQPETITIGVLIGLLASLSPSVASSDQIVLPASSRA